MWQYKTKMTWLAVLIDRTRRLLAEHKDSSCKMYWRKHLPGRGWGWWPCAVREPAVATADTAACRTGQSSQLSPCSRCRLTCVEQYSSKMANKTWAKAGTDINLGCLESRLEKQEATVEECSPERERGREREGGGAGMATNHVAICYGNLAHSWPAQL